VSLTCTRADANHCGSMGVAVRRCKYRAAGLTGPWGRVLSDSHTTDAVETAL